MPTPTRRATRRLLAASHVPIAAYLAFIGTYALAAQPPTHMVESLPAWLITSWAIALIVGAVLIVTGVAADRTRAESSGHALHLFGIALYSTVNLAIDGSTLIVIAVLAAVSLIRLRVLALSRAARREAGRLLYGEGDQ